MSTEDCPGYGNAKADVLKTGCWAEHEDKTLIFIESTEGGRCVYSVFDMSRQPVLEFRDSMAIGAFQREFSWSAGDDTKKDRWTWHNRTPFPWDRVIKAGARDGVRYADVEDQLTAAERIRRRREIQRSQPVDPEEIATRVDHIADKAAQGIIQRVQDAIGKLKPGKADKPKR